MERKPKKQVTSMALDPELRAEIEAYAKERGLSVSAFMAEAMEFALDFLRANPDAEFSEAGL